MRSMFTAINSLYFHQMYMDTVADNLANVNTPGFKSNQFTFKDQMAQLLRSGSAPTTGTPGVNPAQVGLGTNMGAITPMFTQGSMQGTGRNLDLAIQGDGFFVYQSNGYNPIFYSRDGSLTVDGSGYLVNSSTGGRVLGWQDVGGTININAAPSAFQVGAAPAELARATVNSKISGNLDADATTGGNTWVTTMGVYDSRGVIRNISVTFTRGASGSDWTWAASGDGSGSGTLTFNGNGQLPAGTTGTISVTPTTGATTPQNVTVDFTGMSMLRAASSAALSFQDGVAAGNLTGFNVSNSSGEIFALYSNGLQQRMGQVAIARFNNPTGLIRFGDGQYLPGLNSGNPQLYTAGLGGVGTIASGYIEGSNVDMSREFSNMILAQRGFQASSRVITTSDQMLQELVNLKQ